MALTIDPDDVPASMFALIEDGDLDRWMAPGSVHVRDSDGTTADYALDDGSGGAYRVGTATGVLYFRVDLTAGISTGVTGPTVAGALPADTATEIYFEVAVIASTTAGDYTQSLIGPATWDNSGAPGPWGTQPIVFTTDDGLGGRAEVGRIQFSRGVPIVTGEGLDIQLDSAASWPTSYVVTPDGGTMAAQTFNFEDHTGNIRTYRGATDANLLLIHDVYLGLADIIEESTGEGVLQRGGSDYATAAGSYDATIYGMDNYNGGAVWNAAVV